MKCWIILQFLMNDIEVSLLVELDWGCANSNQAVWRGGRALLARIVHALGSISKIMRGDKGMALSAVPPKLQGQKESTFSRLDF